MGFSIGSILSAIGAVGQIAGAVSGAVGGSRANPRDFKGPGPGGHFHLDPTTVPHMHPGGAFGSFIAGSPAARFAATPTFPRVGTFGTRALVTMSAAGASRAMLLARELGVVAAAALLGMTSVQLADLIVRKRRRRRRGITAAQIRITKATMRRLDSLNTAIAKACPTPRRRAPRRTVHHAVHH